MKKLSYLIAAGVLSLVSTTTFAQEVEVVSQEVVSQEVESQEVDEAVAVVKTVAQEKTEIQLSELPEAVTTAIGADLEGFTAEKAFKSTQDGQDIYTVQLSKEGEAIEVNYTAEGKIVQ